MASNFFKRKEILDNLTIPDDRFNLLATTKIINRELGTDLTPIQFCSTLVVTGWIDEDLNPTQQSIEAGFLEQNQRPVLRNNEILFQDYTEFTEKGLKAIVHIMIELKLNETLNKII